jgi:hypothetical protein
MKQTTEGISCRRSCEVEYMAFTPTNESDPAQQPAAAAAAAAATSATSATQKNRLSQQSLLNIGCQ